MPTMETYTKCPTSALRHASNSLPVPSMSISRSRTNGLLAAWITASTPETASANPSPVARSTCAHSTPICGRNGDGCRPSPRTFQPTAIRIRFMVNGSLLTHFIVIRRTRRIAGPSCRVLELRTTSPPSGTTQIMTKKEIDPVALQRPQPPRRRTRWWVAIPIVLVVLVLGGLAYLFQGRIAALFEARPTLPPTAAQSATGILYQSNFDDPTTAADWEIFDHGFISSAVTDGQLVVDVNALEDTGAWSGLNLTFDDYVLDVDATKLAGPDNNAIVVVFRLTDADNYYRFDISSDGFYAVSQVRDGQPYPVSDWNRSAAIVTGSATNHIRIRSIGGVFTFEVNGTPLQLCLSAGPGGTPTWDPSAAEPTCLGGSLVGSWQDTALPQGKIGLGAWGYVGFDGTNPTPALATIAFDNLAIYTPEAAP